jgi:hypothetical protein
MKTYITTIMGQKLYADCEDWMADLLNEYIQKAKLKLH